jgi:glutamyl-tRNA synthetase
MKLLQVAPLLQNRIVTLDDAPEMGGFFFRDEVIPSPETLVGQKLTPEQAAQIARRAYELLKNLPEITHEQPNSPCATWLRSWA